METQIIQLLEEKREAKTNHILHFLLVLFGSFFFFSGLLWIPMWICFTISNKRKRSKINKKINKINKGQ